MINSKEYFIKLNKVNKYFNKRKQNQLHVLNNIEIEFPTKGLVMLLGPSGSGKTTLLNVIGGLDKFDNGNLEVLNKKFLSYKSNLWDELRNYHIGYIFQNYHLLENYSVSENIAYPLRLMGYKDENLIKEKVEYALKSVGMFNYRKKRASQLSGGQKQRIGIARAIVKNPDIVIADEPTGNLDSQNTIEVMSMLKQISKDKLVIMVTHEKDLANFYGDRILSIKDGKIDLDQTVFERENYKFKYDETIYLKDLEKEKLQSKKHNIELFQDINSSSSVDAMLVVKNETLYIKVSSKVRKVKLIDENSSIKIKDSSQEEEQKRIIENTLFEKENLELPSIKKKHSFMFSIKRAFFMAFEKLFAASKKGKIMLFSFFLAGSILAYSTSTIASVSIINPEENMVYQNGYFSISYKSDQFTEPEPFDILDESYYKELNSLIETNDFINSLNFSNFSILSPSGIPYENLSINARLDYIDLLDGRLLSGGSMPESDNEIVITKAMADNYLNSSLAQDIGIWSYENLLQETLYSNELEFRITGILDSDLINIYVSRKIANILSNVSSFRSIESFNESKLIYGEMPENNQILIPNQFAFVLYQIIPEETEWPTEININGTQFQVSGTHSYENQDLFVTQETLELIRFNTKFFNNQDTYLYLSDKKIQNDIENYFEDKVILEDLFETSKAELLNMQALVFASALTSSLTLVGIASLGFYFIIRSSLTKRVKEIAIMRAIGVYKKDIFRAFIIEILILTTFSTMIGYGLSTYGLSLLQDSFINEFNLFKVTFSSIILGAIVAYIINLIFGLMPVLLLLRKSPAQILSDYDM